MARQLERSDVIVYLERGVCRGRGTGMTEFLTAAGDVRYARSRAPPLSGGGAQPAVTSM